MEKVQQVGNHLLTLRKTFLQLEKETALAKEKDLYRQITENASSMFVDFAVLSARVEKPEIRKPLQTNLKSSIINLELREKTDKDSKNIHSEVSKALADVADEVDKIAKVLREDRIPQLLSQMDHANAIRGRYFYLTLIFIATPLFANLMILPQLSEGNMQFFQPIVSATSSLSVMGVLFLLLYIRKILNV